MKSNQNFFASKAFLLWLEDFMCDLTSTVEKQVSHKNVYKRSALKTALQKRQANFTFSQE